MLISLIHLSSVFHSLPYLCLQTFTTVQSRGVEGVCWCSHDVEESGVHMMNEIVRKQWIYGCARGHSFCPAVPGCPHGHRAPHGSHLSIPHLGCPGRRRRARPFPQTVREATVH